MATISGVELSLITSIGGVDITSISDIAGISTSNIPGWPTGATCTTVFYGYADGREREPSESCLVGTFPYDYDEDNGILYQAGYCGNNEQTARIGYYSDGETIYFWDGRNFSEYGTCTPAVGPVNTVAPSTKPTSGWRSLGINYAASVPASVPIVLPRSCPARKQSAEPFRYSRFARSQSE